MNIDIVSGGIDGQGQTVSVCNGTAVHKQIVLLALQGRFLKYLRTFIYLQIIEPGSDAEKACQQQQLPNSQAPDW